MGKLSGNEIFTREVSNDLATYLGLDPKLVRIIIDGLGLYILHKIAEVGKSHRKQGIKEKFKIQVPMIGEITIMPRKYNSTSAIKVSKLDGNAVVTGFNVREPFLEKARMAYYTGEDYLIEYSEKNFNQFIVDNYTKIISDEGDE